MKYMNIAFNPYRSIPLARKKELQKLVENFDKSFTVDDISKLNKQRNKFGLTLHAIASVMGLSSIAAQADNMMAVIYNLGFLKINIDFVQYIRNINKRKAALLSRKLSQNGIQDKNEIAYAVKKYFINLGMPFYPETHPKGMKKIVENGDYLKSFETGIFAARSDKKGLLYKLIRND